MIEPTNATRRAAAHAAFKAYSTAKGDHFNEDVPPLEDMLADILHYLNKVGSINNDPIPDMRNALRSAQGHYLAELKEEA